MKPSVTKILLRSLKFYRKSSVYQILIVLILAAIITGSLLTGYSVRESLKSTSNEHLGNSDLLITSGLRYFDKNLGTKIGKAIVENTTTLIETTGYCQNFVTGITSLNTNIYGIGSDFFSFNGVDSVFVKPGTIAINENLAKQLQVKPGDEIIINYKEITPIPANAPFATDENANRSKVLSVSEIITSAETGNFSLGISQISPLNIFINSSDLADNLITSPKANRLLIENKNGIDLLQLDSLVTVSLKPEDIGLTIRRTESTGGYEIVSDRIFIDKEIIDEVMKDIPSAEPVITYLANRIEKGGKSTPYSFIAALPESIYKNAPSGNKISISSWLAEDLGVFSGDTIKMFWFTPELSGDLKEISTSLIIDKIVKRDSIWGDETLMPAFPGIAGKASCSDWDAGVPVNMKLIRDKDEEYWNNYKGTPKAFINYDFGKELWGSNFGSATAIRFPESITLSEIENALSGKLKPENTGFTITDVRDQVNKAASEGIDFSSLFLSLGIFIIVSCLILLALSVGIFFDSRKGHVMTYFALGFTNKWIENLLFLETFSISLLGAVPGVFAGGLINLLIINALNSVWSGAVQTNTLNTHFAIMPLAVGLLATLLICLVLLKIKTRRFLKGLNRSEKEAVATHSRGKSLLLLTISAFITFSLIVTSRFVTTNLTSILFGAGITAFITLVLLVRHFYIGGFTKNINRLTGKKDLSKLYYSYSPSHAIIPVIIVAAGIFAVFVTGVNRLAISEKMKEPSGGTGGFQFWAETAIPFKTDLNSEAGKREYGLDEDDLKDLMFVQAKKTPGNDASCLNLNHITVPPLLGLDPSYFISNGSFSFASVIKENETDNPWSYLTKNPGENTIYGIADQTVLQWGLKIAAGDTIILKAESGQPLNIIIAAGLESSVFQGYVLIGEDNLNKYFPSVPGSSVMLVSGKPELAELYKTTLQDRFSNMGISVVPAYERLASFFEVTNTYLSVFTILGAFGMLLGVAGLGFVLLRNYNHRKREYALMVATGYSLKTLKQLIYKDQIIILTEGILIGIISAIISTWSSISGGYEIPWGFLAVMSLSVFLTGLGALALASKTIKDESLIKSLRKE